MIISMEVGGRDLHTRCGGEAESSTNAHASKSESRRQKDLFFARMRSCFVERGVSFQFWPELPGCPILKCGVPLELTSKLRSAASGQVGAKRGLHIESAPA